MGIEPDGEHNGEVPAHYLEFAFEMLSAIVTFWFCMDNKLRCDTMRLDIMLADTEESIHHPNPEKMPGPVGNWHRKLTLHIPKYVGQPVNGKVALPPGDHSTTPGDAKPSAV